MDNERQNHLCGDCLSRIIIKKIPEKTDGTLIHSPFDYDDISAGFIKRLKYDYDKSAAKPMVRFMAAYIRSSGFEKLTSEASIVPIPLHIRKLRIRGFNQAELLARGLADEFGFPISDILKRIRKTEPQSLLENNAMRAENVKGSFKTAKAATIPHEIILIDDIWTSGATMREAAKALRDAGVGKIHYLVFARAK